MLEIAARGRRPGDLLPRRRAGRAAAGAGGGDRRRRPPGRAALPPPPQPAAAHPARSCSTTPSAAGRRSRRRAARRSPTTGRPTGSSAPPACGRSGAAAGGRSSGRGGGRDWDAPGDAPSSIARRATRRRRGRRHPAPPRRRLLQVNNAGRHASGDWTRTLFSPALATNRNAPSCRNAIAGKGMLASRDQSVRQDSVPSVRDPWRTGASPVRRSCPSAADAGSVRHRLATPWRCSSVTRATRPASAGLALSGSVLMGALQGQVASGSVRQRELRRLACGGVDKRRRAVTVTRRDEARRHELAQHRGTGGMCAVACRSIANDRRLLQDVVAGAAVEDVLPAAADQHVVAGAAGERVVAGAADQDVVAVAAVGGELDRRPTARPR